MAFGKRKAGTWPVEAEEVDVALIGGGVLSATAGLLLHALQPDWKIVGYERLPKVAKESSNPWNNAGTGHSGLCELNYTKELPDGSMTTPSLSRSTSSSSRRVSCGRTWWSRAFWVFRTPSSTRARTCRSSMATMTWSSCASAGRL